MMISSLSLVMRLISFDIATFSSPACSVGFYETLRIGERSKAFGEDALPFDEGILRGGDRHDVVCHVVAAVRLGG